MLRWITSLTSAACSAGLMSTNAVPGDAYGLWPGGT